MGKYSTVLDAHGKTIQATIVHKGKEHAVSDIIIQSPEEVYETEENVAYVPAKSIWIDRAGAKKIRNFLSDMFFNYEGEMAEASGSDNEQSPSPEQRLRNYFEGIQGIGCDPNFDFDARREAEIMLKAIKYTVDILGIKVEGVSDSDVVR